MSKRTDKSSAPEICMECDRIASWLRSTQFAGDHLFCEEHAKLESDFGESDSYTYWKEFRKIPKMTEIEELRAKYYELVAERDNIKKALDVWFDKTEWVQKTCEPHELGLHRADVIRMRLEQLGKPWVGLTDEERRACTQSPFAMENYLSIEAKLREKNQ